MIEIPVIYLLIGNFEKYSFGLPWQRIIFFHLIFTIVLLLAGASLGLWAGFKWWRYIYIERKYTGRWFKI
jgi:hypothetical protein